MAVQAVAAEVAVGAAAEAEADDADQGEEKAAMSSTSEGEEENSEASCAGSGDATRGRTRAPLPQRCSACGVAAPEELGELQLCPGATEQVLCVRCRFRAMDPFRLVLEPEHILHLASVSSPHISFRLDLPELRQWRKQGHEVEVRSLRRLAPVAGEKQRHPLQQAWPRFLSLEVNGKDVLTVKAPVRRRVRRDVPLAISINLRQGQNEVELCVEDERREDYVLAVVRVSPRKPREMSKKVLRGDAEECLARVQALLAARPRGGVGEPGELSSGGGPAADGIECVGDERLQLRCPITLTRPGSAPVRGELCRHLQCLDLDAFLVANYRMKAFNSRWRCPLCNLELRPQDVCIDAFVQEVLAATPSSVDEVLVTQCGSWRLGGVEAEKSAELEASLVARGEEEEAGPRSAGIKRRRGTTVARCIVEDDEDGPRSTAAGGVASCVNRKKRRRRVHPGGEHIRKEAGERLRRRHAGGQHLSRKARESKNRAHHHQEARQHRHGHRSHRQHSGRAPVGAGPAPHAGPPRPAQRILVLRSRRCSAPPRHAIAVDSDAPPEVVSDSGEDGEEVLRSAPAPRRGGGGSEAPGSGPDAAAPLMATAARFKAAAKPIRSLRVVEAGCAAASTTRTLQPGRHCSEVQAGSATRERRSRGVMAARSRSMSPSPEPSVDLS